jgi:serpin B
MPSSEPESCSRRRLPASRWSRQAAGRKEIERAHVDFTQPFRSLSDIGSSPNRRSPLRWVHSTMTSTSCPSLFLSRRSLLVGSMGACLGFACREPQRGVSASASEPTARASASAVPTPDHAQLAAAGDLGFALALYGQASKATGNIAFSPLALRVALAMVHEGARGQTRRELGALLRLPEEDGLRAIGSLRQHWLSLGESTADAERALVRSRDPDPVVFRTNAASAAWVSKHRPLHAPYARQLQTALAARVSSVDFGNSAATAGEINAWSDAETRHRIPSLVQPSDLAGLELLLTSAVWMHARWERPFTTRNTEPFHLSEARKVDVDMVSGGVRSLYARADGVQLLELPYWNNLASMLLVLPEGHDLARVERSIDEALVRSWRAKLESKPVIVHLPEFEASVKCQVDRWLRDLGAASVFDGAADLSGMASGALRVSGVRHTAKIRTDAAGTKLAAVADVDVAISHPGTNQESPVFRADRPFFYVIADRRYGSILFMGRVADPRS